MNKVKPCFKVKMKKLSESSDKGIYIIKPSKSKIITTTLFLMALSYFLGFINANTQKNNK